MNRVGYSSIIILFSLFIIITACEKESQTNLPAGDYITENLVNLKVVGVYEDVELDENYNMLFTENKILISEEVRVVYTYNSIDTITFNLIEFEIFSQDLESKMSFHILFNETSYEVNYYHDFAKKSNNGKLNIQGQNSFIVPMGTNKEIPEEMLPKIYKIRNFDYDSSKGSITFKFDVTYQYGTDTKYSLEGDVLLFVYNK